ncbi:family 43 glycoside hydrolase [Melampsora larici-populina 98AG31]|uniref:Family 43 glycoside hydrolase n=1 Tax=Melampsora larici-populina (strain 98AG31 / pathotype 3-4-7) TaxID=747676 RepID=F4R614_MELLP|nr:family 43 glycoside hydrolase [Melampsora larici-populina 98AG31]EGG12140.1 family 43 glycoside hydrolase [Melampsora larici-populina 98AG31]
MILENGYKLMEDAFYKYGNITRHCTLIAESITKAEISIVFPQLKDQWYWFGEDKEKGYKFKGCYRSNNLLTWTRLPNVLTSTAGTPLNENMVVERPRVLFNKATNKFVMYFHYDSRDLSLFQDDDGTGYVIFASDQRVVDGLEMSQMDVKEIFDTDGNNGWGYMDLLKKGWSANPNKVITTRNLAGPWSKDVDIADPKLNTYSSQNTYDLTVTGSKARSHISVSQLKLGKTPGGRLTYENVNPTLKFQKISGNSPDGGAAEWCSIFYTSPGGTYQTGKMSVNGGGKFDVDYPPTSAQISIPVRINLKPGGGNSIEIVTPSGVKVDYIILY